MFTGSGLVKGQYAKDVASSDTLSPYANCRFLNAVLDGLFLSKQERKLQLLTLQDQLSLLQQMAEDEP